MYPKIICSAYQSVVESETNSILNMKKCHCKTAGVIPGSKGQGQINKAVKVGII